MDSLLFVCLKRVVCVPDLGMSQCMISVGFLHCVQVDKEGANPDQVMQELSTHGLMPEDWGGDVPMVQVRHFNRSIFK